MFPDPSQPRSPFDSAPRPPRRVRPAHMAAIGAVSAAALGLMGLKFVNLPDAAPVAPGDALKIEVVAPVEPKAAPGSVMEVGELVDGFRYAPPPPAERAPVHDAAWMEAGDLAPPTPPTRPANVRRHASSDADARPFEPEPPRRDRERSWFGFDNSLPDFGADRRARRARLDALEDQRRAEFEDRAAPRRYSSEPPRYEQRRDDGPSYDPPRDERPAGTPSDGPWGPEVG